MIGILVGLSAVATAAAMQMQLALRLLTHHVSQKMGFCPICARTFLDIFLETTP